MSEMIIYDEAIPNKEYVKGVCAKCGCVWVGDADIKPEYRRCWDCFPTAKQWEKEKQ